MLKNLRIFLKNREEDEKMTNLETLKQKVKEMQAEIERLENGWEMKCPYEEEDEYWVLDSHGNILLLNWDGYGFEENRLNQGNTFLTEEAALLESKRRNLLTRFKAFRDECNGNWKPKWSGNEEMKAYIQYHEQFNKFVIKYTLNRDVLQTFGFFKCKQDAEHAIELFGDEIKELYVDCEVQ